MFTWAPFFTSICWNIHGEDIPCYFNGVRAPNHHQYSIWNEAVPLSFVLLRIANLWKIILHWCFIGHYNHNFKSSGQSGSSLYSQCPLSTIFSLIHSNHLIRHDHFNSNHLLWLAFQTYIVWILMKEKQKKSSLFNVILNQNRIIFVFPL